MDLSSVYGRLTGYENRHTLGSIVVDGDDESDDQNTAVVVSVPKATIDEWNVPVWSDHTVADDNPSYDDDEWVTVVVFEHDLDDHFPFFSGFKPLSLPKLNELDVKFYSFPDSRLDRVGIRRAVDIDLESIRPSPLHTQSFLKSENQSFIEETRSRGYPVPYPIVRVLPEDSQWKFEVIDGHKRLWISHISGCETIKCTATYMDEESAFRMYTERHWKKLSDSQKSYVREKISEYGFDTSYIIP